VRVDGALERLDVAAANRVEQLARVKIRPGCRAIVASS
jgi:hypothetical protein